MNAVETKTQASIARKTTPFFSKERGQDFFQAKRSDQPFFAKVKSTTPTIQTKLTIGQPNDPYEKEADAMADQVVERLSGKETVQTKPLDLSHSITPFVQAKCAGCEEEEKLQKKEEDKDELIDKIQRKPIFESDASVDEEKIQRKCASCEEEEKVQRKGEGSGGSASPSIETQLNSSKGSGSSLPDNTRQQLESSFGADFSNVKIHTGSSAIQMSKGLNAQAFTRGSDIYFNEGKYDANSNHGKHLLAHELTHVVQQKSAGGNVQKQSAVASASPKVCGPNVSAPVSTVWNSIKSDFHGWSATDKLAASLYLISPYVPEGGVNPRSAGGAPLFSGSFAEPIISFIAGLAHDPFLSAYVNATNSQWQLNRDAFDTIGLFVLSADWTFRVPGCGVPGCNSLSSADLPRGVSDSCEDPSTCSLSVQMGGDCWLSGTVNYGTYGIMMKEAYIWCSQQRTRMLSLLPGILLYSLGDSSVALAMLRSSMDDKEIAAAFLKELFSETSLIVYVGGYKLWDMENPTAPLSWALATYRNGPSGMATRSNRPQCQTTCAPLGSSVFSGWDYVWEPVKHRNN